MKKVLDVSNIDFCYTNDNKILSNVSFSVSENEIVGVLGRNGSGKSTLLNLIAHFLDAKNGTITIDGIDNTKISFKERSKLMTYIQQNSLTIPPYYKLEDFIIEGLRPYKPFGFYTKDDYKKLDKIIDECDLRDFNNRFLSSLSGGEKQRAIFARAIMKNTPLYIFDEPCSAMDIKYQKEFFNIAHRIKNNYRAAILLTIHDINLAVQNCDRLIVLNNGEIIYNGNAKDVTKEIISQAFDLDVKTECAAEKYFYW